MRIRHVSLAWPVVCLLAACTSEPERARAIGEAYVGPATLELRKDLSQRSEVAARLQHGERLEVLAIRRRFVRVRNLAGEEGWLDSRHLLSGKQIQNLRRMLETARQLPSQGQATVSDVLNVHSEPNRQAPSPFQLQPDMQVDVLGHTVADRVPYPPILPAILYPVKPAPKKPKKRARQREEDDAASKEEIPLPPMPKAPPPPRGWQDTGRAVLPGWEPRRRDDWTLIRTRDNHAGWVLTRMLNMSIPDEVAQYANGRRIMGYFPMGSVEDEGQTKQHWLMLTVSEPYQPHDFDAWRVLVYNTKRHRYETAGAERELRGFYPVVPLKVDVSEGRRTFSADGFSILVEDRDGKRWKRIYAFSGGRTRLLRREEVNSLPGAFPDAPAVAPLIPQTPAASPNRGLLTRLREWFQ